MIKSAILIGFFVLLAGGYCNRKAPDLLLPEQPENYALSETEKQASTAFMHANFTHDLFSVMTTIEYASTGCFHRWLEKMQLEKGVDNMIVTLQLENNADTSRIRKYAIPNHVFQYAITRFNNAYAILLKQKQQKKTDGSRFLSTTVTTLAVQQGPHAVSIFIDEEDHNPFPEFKRLLVREAYLIRSVTGGG